MIEIIEARNRHFKDSGWLKTYWLFSFSDYYDPKNMHFGALRVFNDDVVEALAGFPMHPHKDMEIVTVVLEGEITHQDDLGNKFVLEAGEVQRMSAGSGVTHSESNNAEFPCHLYQIWIYPAVRDMEPSYSMKKYSLSSWENELFPIASGQGIGDAVSLNTDATIYRTALAGGHSIKHSSGDSRGIFIYVTSGKLQVGGKLLSPKYQARITGEKLLKVTAKSDADFILIDIPMNTP